MDAVVEVDIPFEMRDLPVDDLVIDPNLNLRDRLDDEIIHRYAENFDRLPPMTVFDIEGRWLVADGFHRHAAAVILRKPRVSAQVRAGDYHDALDFAASSNHRHGLPLNRHERRRAVEIKLKLHPDWSDRRLADELCASRDTIAKTRRLLSDAGEIPSGACRVGADGKFYPVGLPKDPFEQLPKGPAVAQEDNPHRKGRVSQRAWDSADDPIEPTASSQPQITSAASPPSRSRAKADSANGVAPVSLQDAALHAPWEGTDLFAPTSGHFTSETQSQAQLQPQSALAWSSADVSSLESVVARLLDIEIAVYEPEFELLHQNADPHLRKKFHDSVQTIAARAKRLARS